MEITAVAHQGQSPEPPACGAAPEELGMKNQEIKEVTGAFPSKVNAVPSASII